MLRHVSWLLWALAEAKHARILADDLHDFLLPKSCAGPQLVLFSKASDLSERQSFEDAAREIAGLACLGILDCSSSKALCAQQNVQRTPTVLLYPTGNRAARVYRGRFTEEGFTSAVAHMIGFNDRTVPVSHKTLSDFITGRTRPIKVLLFSRRQRAPVIFKALSSDAELWPHMDFGFVPEELESSRNPLLDAYGITTVPSVLVQYGPDLSTKQIYDSTDITYPALKEWLLARRGEFWLGAPTWQEVKPPEPEAVLEEEPESNYELLAPGTAGCPSELEIKSVSECQAALKELGIDVDPRWVSNYPELPSKCSVRESPSPEHPERMHFNSFVGGAGRQDLSPVCKRRGAATPTPQVQLDLSGLPEQFQRMLQNVDLSMINNPTEIDFSELSEGLLQQLVQNLDLNAGEIDLSEIMSKLTSGKAKQTKQAKPTKPKPKEAEKVKREYVKLPNGAPGCPAGTEILTFEECRQAIASLGLKPDPSWTSSYEGLPRHCSVRERPADGVGVERMHFNNANRGEGRDDLAPVCRKPGPSGGAMESPSQRAGVTRDNTNIIQELNGKTQRRLLSKEKYYLVYMKQGGLTYSDESMLLDIKDQIQQRLDERGVAIEFLWLDLSVERQIRSLLDPPALPSAMVLRGGTQPKFVLARHEEEDDDAVGVREQDIVLLLKMVLGDDARFQRLNPKKLEMSWSKK